MNQIGITQTAYTDEYGYVQGLEKMKLQGFDSMDYQGFLHTQTPLFEKNGREFEQFLIKQKEIAQSIGIEIHQAHGPWRWPAQDQTPEDRTERFEKMVRSLEGTAILECKNMVIHPIMPYLADDRGHEQETYEINLDFMHRLAQKAGEYGVTLCLENMPMPRLSLGSVAAVMDFVKMVDHPFLKVCLDTGHNNLFPISAGEAVRMIGKEYLCALHIHDNDGQEDRHWQPFTGTVGWDDFAAALSEISYEGVISLEPHLNGNSPQLQERERVELYQKAERITQMVSAHQY